MNSTLRAIGDALTRGAFRATDLPESDLLTPQTWLAEMDGGNSLSAAMGVHVTAHAALRIPWVYSCVNIISKTIAMLPLMLYRRGMGSNSKSKEYATDHPLYSVLHDAPNEEMTAYNFRLFMQRGILLRGNGYAVKAYDGAGRVAELWPLRPDFTMVTRNIETGRLEYRYASARVALLIQPEDILHVRAPSRDGIMGISPIDEVRDTVGQALALQEYGQRFFGNNANPGGGIKLPPGKKLTKDSRDRLRDDFERMHQGLKNAHRIAILEDGAEFQQFGLSPENAQFIESKKLSRSEIAAIFNLPPHMIGDLERATFSNIEQQGIDFVTGTMLPWLKNWEQEIWKSLLADGEKRRLFAEFMTDALLRGDFKTRVAGYALALTSGWSNVNEIREKENLNPLAPEIGEVYRVPLNMGIAGQMPADSTAGDSDGADPAPDEPSSESKGNGS